MSLDAQTPAQDPASPDQLFAARTDSRAGQRAIALWEAQLTASPADYDTAWKLSRAYYWLGTAGAPPPERRSALEKGITRGRLATTLQPERVEGFFWMAASMGSLAEAYGLRQGLKYRTPIRTALEQARRLDPEYLDGSPDRALGRWYAQVPSMFGGDLARAESHLRAALARKPDSVVTLVFLAEVMEERKQVAEARRLAQAALDAPVDPAWAAEDATHRESARKLLARLKGSGARKPAPPEPGPQ